MPDPRVVDVWMRWEFDKLNAGIVQRPRTLSSLLRGETLQTREGEAYHVERPILERLAAACSSEEAGRLRLPVSVHFSADVADAAFVIDALAADVLRRLEGWGPAYPFRDGRMWLPHSLAVDLLFRYGGALQRLML
ncbi:MAG TPA: DUF61 family protein [Thermoplasmata archaeon]|nr:DUF61 family protein [Thermoplasmata archaeon]